MTKVCLLVILSFAWAGLMSAEVPSAVAIKDARVVTVSGADLPKATVLLRNGLIQDVGPNLTIPADAWVIDGTSLTVYPGFIDGLSTWGIPELATPAPAATRTAAQSPAPNPAPAAQAPRAHGPDDRPQTYSYERAADMIKPTDRRLEAARSAGFTSSATFPNRGIIAGLGAMVNLAGDRGAEMVVAQPIGEQIILRTAGFRAGFPNSLMGVLAYVRQVYLDSEQYKQAKLIYASRVSGQGRPAYDHYLEGLAEAPRILLPASEAQQIDRIIAFSAELKQPTVLYGLHEAFRRIPEIKQSNLPVLVSLKWPEKPREANPADVPSLRELELRANAPSVPGLLARAGVKFALYSDTVDQAADLKKAIKKAIDAGLSRADAIRALTLNTAEIYGLSDRLGSIDKGKIANLVVMKGEAFEDKTTVEYVFVDGKLFEPSKETPASLPAGTPKRPESDGHRDEADVIGDGGQN
ncbi:MAG: amidohydrolase family protein [Bryobacteraceae bacterium]